MNQKPHYMKAKKMRGVGRELTTSRTNKRVKRNFKIIKIMRGVEFEPTTFWQNEKVRITYKNTNEKKQSIKVKLNVTFSTGKMGVSVLDIGLVVILGRNFEC